MKLRIIIVFCIDDVQKSLACFTETVLAYQPKVSSALDLNMGQWLFFD
ncbi:hypothetical protein [Methyloglobulus sp.]